MLICKFCGTALPDQAHFCSTCGKKPGDDSDVPTGAAIEYTELHDLADKPTVFIRPDSGRPFSQDETRPLGVQTEQGMAARDFPGKVGDDEEEQQGLLLLPQIGNAPLVSGTPYIGGAPSVPGTPYIGGAPSVPGAIPAGSYRPQSYPEIQPPGLPLILPKPASVGLPPTLGFGPILPVGNQPPAKPPTPKPKPGCNILVALLLLPFLILGGLFALSLTIYAPDLAITVNGSADTTVASGGQFKLHGNNFIPGPNVTLTLDSAPLYVNTPSQASQRVQNKYANQMLFVGQHLLSSRGSNIVNVGNNGKFDVTIHVGPDWRLGTHILQADENLSPRNAKVSITVIQPGIIATPTATIRPSATTTVTTTPSPTTTATPGTAGLSTIIPNAVHLGPISASSSQVASSQVTLNTVGTDLLDWTASWDIQQNSWLQLSPTSGQIQAPSAQPLRVSAQAGSLNAGTYTATVTFSSTVNAQTVVLNVIFTIQSACIAANPTSLNFTALTGGTDPTPQTFALSNCGQLVSAWSLTQIGNLPNWLRISPMNGTLNTGDAQNITVGVTNADGQLKTGSINQATLLFFSGTSQVAVQITFTIGSGPTLNVSNATLKNCPFNQDRLMPVQYTCDEFLSVNTLAQQISTNWTVTSSGIAGILFTDTNDQPLNGGILLPGQTVHIKIHIPRTPCPNSANITFTGPTNFVPVTWSC